MGQDELKPVMSCDADEIDEITDEQIDEARAWAEKETGYERSQRLSEILGEAESDADREQKDKERREQGRRAAKESWDEWRETQKQLHVMAQEWGGDDQRFREALEIMFCGAYVKQTVGAIQNRTGIKRERVQEVVKNLLANGIWQDGKVYILAEREDEQAIQIILCAMCGDGKLVRIPDASEATA